MADLKARLNISDDEGQENKLVLVDTSIWIDHFNRTDSLLQLLLNDGEVVINPFILGELSCGNIKNRKVILGLLKELPIIKNVSDEEFYFFVEKHQLHGLGLGFVDIHLLASSLLARCSIYTRDKTLFSVADSFKIAFK